VIDCLILRACQTVASTCSRKAPQARIRAILSALIGVALAVATANVSRAQFAFIFDWNNPSGGSYASQFNWTSITGGIPDGSNEIARFQQVNAAYAVQIDADYTVGSLAARQQGSPTLEFTPPGTFTPRKIYNTGELSVDPTAGGTVTLGLSEGDVRVSGDTFVGRDTSSGQANLDLNSGVLTTAGAQVGAGSDSAGYVTVSDIGDWTGNGMLTLGGAGDAQLDIMANYRTNCFIVCVTSPSQGQVTSAGVAMAQDEASDAAANIYGLWNTGDMVVGDAGEAQIRVLGTQLTSPGGINVSSVGGLSSANVSVGAQAGSSGSVEITGFALMGFTPLVSQWNITGGLNLGGTSGAAGGNGSLTIGPPNLVTVGSNLKIWSGGKLVLGESGDLTVTGAANLGGTLEFLLLQTTHPQLNDTYQILTAGSVAGTFNATVLPPLDPGLQWEVQYGPTSVSLLVAEGLPGDHNKDDTVDAADYVAWRKNPRGNFTQSDYDTWRVHFGETLGGGPSPSIYLATGNSPALQATVPEPSCLTMLLLAAAGWFSRRRSRS